MFFDLKEVLNLTGSMPPIPTLSPCRSTRPLSSTTPCGSPRAKPRRNWTCRPKNCPPAKLFPKIAVASFLYLHAQEWERRGAAAPPAHPHLVIRWRRPSMGARGLPHGCASSIEATSDAGAASAPHSATGNRSVMFGGPRLLAN